MIPRLILNALRYLRQQPVRTVLILQGVIWGTALGVFPAAIIHGSMRKIEREATALGADRIFLTFDQLDGAKALDWSDLASMRREYAAEVRSLSGMTVVGEETGPGAGGAPPFPVLAADAEALSSRGMEVRQGRFFTAEEVRSVSMVCVLESEVAAALYPNETAVGQTLDLGEAMQLVIVGVTADRTDGDGTLDEFGYESGHSMSTLAQEMKRNFGVVEDARMAGLRRDRHIIVPHTLFPGTKPDFVEMRAEPRDIPGVMGRLRADLIQRHLQPILFAHAAIPFLYGGTLDTMLEMNRVVFVCCVAVGTCIVCVMMILSIVERQREIAIRRVEGAQRWHIALQLIVETGTICAVGGVLGVPLGLGLAAIRCALEPLAAVDWAFPPAEASIMVIVVTMIGLIGGLLPAWRAVRVDPISILRYE
jgi:hypothetical protein